MNLVKEKWTKQDGKEFNKYLETLKNEDRIEWTTNLLRTNLKVLAIKAPVIKSIVKEIKKGNYLSFLDLNLHDYYDDTAISCGLISSIKDFDVMVKYMKIYSKTIDNWASCDTLSFNVKNREEQFYNLALEYIKSKLPFERRLGLSILFKLVDNDEYIDKILEICNKFEKEEEYYVNMINAWLLCDCFIKQRNKTMKFLKNNNLNNFTINKTVSKCRDSYRVKKEDKDYLLKFKRK